MRQYSNLTPQPKVRPRLKAHDLNPEATGLDCEAAEIANLGRNSWIGFPA